MSWGYCALGSGCFWPLRPSQGPLPTTGNLCRHCEHAVEKTLLNLLHDYYQLSQIIAKTKTRTEKTSTNQKPGPSTPIDLTIDTLRSHITWTATLWEEHTRHHSHLPPREYAGHREGANLQTAIQILAPRIPILAAIGPTRTYTHGIEAEPTTATGIDACKTFLTLHKAAQTLIGATSQDTNLPGDCPHCHHYRLRRADGTDTVYCRTCDFRTTYADYTRRTSLLVSGHLEMPPGPHAS